MIKIYNKILNLDDLSRPDMGLVLARHDIPFLIEKNKWRFVKDPSQADVLLTLGAFDSTAPFSHIVKPHHVILVLSIFHIDDMLQTPEHDSIMRGILSTVSDKVVLVHKNSANTEPNNVYYDHMFNREKLYFTDYRPDWALEHKVWTQHTNQAVFTLAPIKKTPIKQFLSMSRTYGDFTTRHPRMAARSDLRELLSDHNGYVSNPNLGKIIYPNGMGPQYDFHLIEGGTWVPAADIYYETSYVSIYIETITFSKEVKCVTEKTFDPLIKGHFILPFGYRGLINDIKSYGFKLPDWIDYSYDDIDDNEDRFREYKRSVLDLLKIDVSTLHGLYMKDRHLLDQNRQVFFNRPYDTLHDKVIAVMESNNWIKPKSSKNK